MPLTPVDPRLLEPSAVVLAPLTKVSCPAFRTIVYLKYVEIKPKI